MSRAWPALALAAAVAAACAHPGRRGAEERPPRAEGVEEGLASFYASSFEGRLTASGDRYRGGLMTCAHRTLPFGTWLRVTDVATGRSVRVRVNDRGPYARGRIVDLSLAAARELGIVERGVVRVRVERVAPRGEPGVRNEDQIDDAPERSAAIAAR